MSRPQKQCIFCDNPANSKEHFWPEWMHDLLPQLPDPRHNRELHEYHPKVGRSKSGVNDRPGGLQTIKIRVVCDACNNGWMNRIEREARPFLTQLINGAQISLNAVEMAVVARWIAVKCIVAEHATPNYELTPRADRVVLREHGVLPEYFRVYLINHKVAHGIGYVRHSLGLSLDGPPSDPPAWGTPKNVQTISFFLGRILVHLNAARIDNYSIESRYLLPQIWNECRIWPFQRPRMTWPRRPLLDDNGVTVVASALAEIIAAADITWLDPTHPPRGNRIG
jgi:hypothetical protein